MARRTVRTGGFVAIDAQGKSYSLDVLREYVDVVTTGGSSRIGGLKAIHTKDGKEVNRIEKGKYLIVETNTELTSNDQNAP
jgi:hypothetical protein